jgi:hypothetical protein
LIPFRLQPPPPRLREGYRLLADADLGEAELSRLNQLLSEGNERPRSTARWQQVLARSTWHLSVINGDNRLVGFVRATSDRALNANLWDLCADLADPAATEVLEALVAAALARLRRELSGCSISLAAPPAALAALQQQGFLVDPGGIRAMGLRLD